MALDCIFCGKTAGRDFNSLAYHVAHTCIEAARRRDMGTLPARAARDSEAPMAVKKSTNERLEDSYKSGSIPDAGEGPDLVDFLKPEHLGPTKKGSIVFLGPSRLVTESEYGDQIVCSVKVGGSIFDFSVKIGKPNHQRMQKKMGRTIKPGTKFEATVKISHGKDYIALV